MTALALWLALWSLDAGGVAAADATVAAADAVVAAPLPPDAPTVVARVDKTEVKVGDPIELTIVAVGHRTTPINLPATLDDALAPFVVLERHEREKDLGDGRMQREFVLSVAVYEPGDTAVPAVEVTYLGKGGAVLTMRTQPVAIRVASLLANEPEPALKDNAAPVDVLERNLLVLYIAAGLALAALGAVVTTVMRRRMRTRAAQGPVPPALPPHEIALAALDRLGAQFVPDADHRPMIFQLSEIVRAYLGARFGFEALEMTTEELIDELDRRASRDLIMGEVAGWLSGCDLVKFAKISPSAAEARGALETAIRLVSSTRPRPEPQVGQGGTVPAVEAGAIAAHAQGPDDQAKPDSGNGRAHG